MAFKFFLVASSVLGFLAVALGAFGAHALRGFLQTAEAGAQRAEWWQTATQYLMVHALAVGLVALAADRVGGSATNVAGYAFIAGCVIFCGSLYVMTLSNVRWLGAITPIGGTAFLVGWGALALAALRAG